MARLGTTAKPMGNVYSSDHLPYVTYHRSTIRYVAVSKARPAKIVERLSLLKLRGKLAKLVSFLRVN